MRVIIIFLFVILNLIVHAQPNLFEKYNNWTISLENAKKDKKVIALYFGASWCAPCKELEKNVFVDSGVVDELQKSISFYKFDIDENPSILFLKKFRITSVPIIVLLDSSGMLISRIENIEQEKSLFPGQILSSAKQRGLYPGINSSLTITYPDFYDNFFDNKMKIAPDSNVVDSFLRGQDSLFTEVNWGILSLFNTSDYYLEFVLLNRKKFTSLFGPEVPFKIHSMYSRLANKYIDSKDSLSYNRIARMFLEPANSSYSENSIRTFLVRELKFLGSTGIDWDKFNEKFRSFNLKFGATHNHFFLNYSYNTGMKVKDARDLVLLFQAVPKEMPTAQVNFEYGILSIKAKLKRIGNKHFEMCLAKCANEEELAHYKNLIDEVKMRR